MKYYGFKFQSFNAFERSSMLRLGTWIGLAGTFLFLLTIAETQTGFRGYRSNEFSVAVLSIALFYFLNYLTHAHPKVLYAIRLISSLVSLLILTAVLTTWPSDFTRPYSVYGILFFYIGLIYFSMRVNIHATQE